MIFPKEDSVKNVPVKRESPVWRGVACCAMIASGCICMVMSLVSAMIVMMRHEK